MRYLAAFGRFWWDFIVGDDWRIAAGVVAVLAAGAVVVAATDLADRTIAVLVGCGILGVACASIVGGALAAAKRAGE